MSTLKDVLFSVDAPLLPKRKRTHAEKGRVHEVTPA